MPELSVDGRKEGACCMRWGEASGHMSQRGVVGVLQAGGAQQRLFKVTGLGGQCFRVFFVT